MKKAQTSVLRAARLKRSNPRDFATTLSIIVLSPSFTVATQIGDGASVAKTATCSTFLLLAPDRGEYVNATSFLHNSNLDTDLVTAVRNERVTFLASFTDGLIPVALAGVDKHPHEPFIDSLSSFWLAAKEGGRARSNLKSFLRSERLRERTSDDLTLVLAGPWNLSD